MKIITLFFCLFLTTTVQANLIIDFDITYDTREILSLSGSDVDNSFSSLNFLYTVHLDLNSLTIVNDFEGPSISSNAEIPLSAGPSPVTSELLNNLDHVSSNIIFDRLRFGVQKVDDAPGDIQFGFDTINVGALFGFEGSQITVDTNGQTIDSRAGYNFSINDPADFFDLDVSGTLNIEPITLESILSEYLFEGMIFLVNESYSESSIVRFPNEVLHQEGIQYTGTATISNLTIIPIPAAIWLFISSFVGLIYFFREKNN